MNAEAFEMQSSGTSNKREFLTFRLCEEEYAINILQVREIRGWEPVTRIPNAPPWVCGLVNLRGAIVPVVDLRRRLGLPTETFTKHSVVILVTVGKPQERVIGMVVDALSDAVSLDIDSIQATPDNRMAIDTQFIEGLSEVNGSMLMLLNLELVLDIDCL